MKSTTPRKIIGTNLQILTREAREQVLCYEQAILCLMVLIAITSLMWSIALVVLTGDFYDGIISAKYVFRPRDFKQMDSRTLEILKEDSHKILDEIYAADAARYNNNSEVTIERRIKKPIVPKIAHVFASIKDMLQADSSSNETDTPNHTTATTESLVPAEVNEMLLMENIITTTTTTTISPTLKSKIAFNPKADYTFLSTMSVDAFETYWSDDVKAQFVYNFPFLSEIVSIVWAGMCFIYQTGGSQKAWGLPKPWRIVLPSLVVFILMSLGNLMYTIVTNGCVKKLCSDLRGNLTKPDVISCGQAITLLRPYIRPHSIPHEAYLNIFRVCYILTMVLWMLALLLMLLRYLLAIDFQLVDLEDIFERPADEPDVKLQQVLPYIEVSLDSPQHQTKQQQQQQQQQQKQQQTHLNKERPKSEDDFQSAKSHLSEQATPLLADGQRLPIVA